VSDESPLAKPQGLEPCEECGAPMDPQQRYCVECAARRGNGSNPSSRYFAAMSKKSRRPLTKSQSKQAGGGGGSRAAAVGFFALLPIAVALGVVVGRSGGSGDSNEEALLKALHQAETQQVAAAPVEEVAVTTPKANAKSAKANGKSKKASSKANAKKAQEADTGKVLNKTKNGTVHEVTGFEPTKAKEEADTKLVEENPEQTGENYIKAQQNLPDVTVVGGEGTGTEEASTPGVEP
jgi:hypothetical protein